MIDRLRFENDGDLGFQPRPISFPFSMGVAHGYVEFGRWPTNGSETSRPVLKRRDPLPTNILEKNW